VRGKLLVKQNNLLLVESENFKSSERFPGPTFARCHCTIMTDFFTYFPATRCHKLRLDTHAPMAYTLSMFTFIESTVFERELPFYLDDEEYAALQDFMMDHPEAGDLIQGSGGVRKFRWRRPGSGKRSGVRVVYYVRYQPNEFWMLTIYGKAKHDNVPPHILKALKERFSNDSQA
jgi:hypothetical protein